MAEVVGSSPTVPMIVRDGVVAQMEERRTRNAEAVGSSPTFSTLVIGVRCFGMHASFGNSWARFDSGCPDSEVG